MDQDVYRKTYQQINARDCLFEKCLFAGHGSCHQADRFNLAEREGIHCKSDAAQARCGAFLDLLRQHSRFLLKSSDEKDVLSHSQALRLQVGGIRGLDQVIEPREEPKAYVDDINRLMERALEHGKHLDELPFNEIIQQVAAFKGRRG